MDKSSKGGGKKCDEVEKKGSSMEKSYFDVLGLCCSSEVPLIEKILKPLEGVVEVSVIVPSRTVIVVHDNLLISQQQIGMFSSFLFLLLILLFLVAGC